MFQLVTQEPGKNTEFKDYPSLLSCYLLASRKSRALKRQDVARFTINGKPIKPHVDKDGKRITPKIGVVASYKGDVLLGAEFEISGMSSVKIFNKDRPPKEGVHTRVEGSMGRECVAARLRAARNHVVELKQARVEPVYHDVKIELELD